MAEREGAENPRQGSTGLNNCIGRKADRDAAELRCVAVRARDGSHQSLGLVEYHDQVTDTDAGGYGGERVREALLRFDCPQRTGVPSFSSVFLSQL